MLMFPIRQILRLQAPLLAGLFAVAPLMALPLNPAFTAVDVPAAGTGTQQGTFITAMNASGDVTGFYVDSGGIIHGFLLPAGGTVTTFDAATGANAGRGTFPTGINAAGVIAGTYNDNNIATHGFIRAANGTITLFDDPNAPTATPNRGTIALSINDAGVVAGFYSTGSLGTGALYGFQRAANGTFTGVNDPNAGGVTNGFKEGTSARAINASGEIVGSYYDSNHLNHGFLLDQSSTYHTIDVSGAGTACIDTHGNNFGGTSAFGIDTAGDIVGTYYDTNCAQHGYILKAGSTTPAIFDAPGAETSPCNTSASGEGKFLCGTFLMGIDAAGDITGGDVDSNGVLHGFIRPAATGVATTFEDASAGTSEYTGTLGITIASTTNGIMVAGPYADNSSSLHGFIYTPALTATTTTLTPVPAPNPSVYWEPVTLSATVSSSAGTPQNGENVTFMSGTTALGTGTLSAGVATLTTTALATGTDSITAVYGGDSELAGSTSTAVSQTVNKASSSTTLTSSLNPSTTGQSVTLIANVSGQFAGTATGTVAFSYGSGTSLGSAMLSGGTASLATTALPTGTDAVIAVYGGDGNFTGSTSSALSQVVNAATSNPSPIVGGISPAFASAGGAAFTLTVNGSEFVANSTVYWGTSALTTTYVNATQLTAQVPASDIATGGIAAAITVVTPTPGGGTSKAFQFEVDSASGSTTGPTFSSTTETVTAGSTATYPVTLPSSVESATVTCLNLPTGASCNYSSTANTLTITTTAATPAGTYQVTVVFTETVSGAASSWILLPILLIPLVLLRRRLAARGVWVTACFGLVLLVATAIACTGCGGGGSTPPPPPQTHQVTSSATITLIVQ